MSQLSLVLPGRLSIPSLRHPVSFPWRQLSRVREHNDLQDRTTGWVPNDKHDSKLQHQFNMDYGHNSEVAKLVAD